MARKAVIGELKQLVAECERKLWCMERAGSFEEYTGLVEEMGGGDEARVDG